MTPEEGVAMERAEAVKDLQCFQKMKILLDDRLLEVREADIPEGMKVLPRWAGTDAIRGLLEILVYQMEHTVRAYEDLDMDHVKHVHHTEVEPAENVIPMRRDDDG